MTSQCFKIVPLTFTTCWLSCSYARCLHCLVCLFLLYLSFPQPMPNIQKSLFFAVFALLAGCRSSEVNQDRLQLADEIEHSAQTGLLDKWYPDAVDSVYGGFLSTFTYDFKPAPEQNKMIVSQARHVWTTAKAAMAYPERDYFIKASAHGAKFLKNVMWDKTYGGFYQLVDREGKVIAQDEK